jgi:hypothetical protein
MSKNKQTATNLPGAGPGRPKGSQNKTTKLLKDAIIRAAELTGSDQEGTGGLVGYCQYLAKEEPKAFAGLMGKVLPMQVTGEDGGAVQVVIKQFTIAG